jgi:hypothetical protein
MEHRNRRKENFKIRAQFAGMLYWTCPKCGHLNSTRLAPIVWRVSCGASGCGRQLMVGLNFYYIAPGLGGLGIPPDGVVGMQDSMPQFTISGTWRTGEPVHRIVQDTEHEYAHLIARKRQRS